MGRGNSIIRSYDMEMYSPNTYYIDFTSGDTNETVKEHFINNDRDDFDELSQAEINNEYYSLIGWDVESFMEDYFFNLEKPWDDTWEKPSKGNDLIDDLSASYRGCAVIIAENDDAMILTTDEAEHFHFPIGLVPNFKLEDITEDIYQENSDKIDWYESRGLDYEEKCSKDGKKEYEKRLKKWRKKYQPFMKYFHSHWKNVMSVRTCAWTSTPIKTVGKNYEFI